MRHLHLIGKRARMRIEPSVSDLRFVAHFCDADRGAPVDGFFEKKRGNIFACYQDTGGALVLHINDKKVPLDDVLEAGPIQSLVSTSYRLRLRNGSELTFAIGYGALLALIAKPIRIVLAPLEAVLIPIPSEPIGSLVLDAIPVLLNDRHRYVSELIKGGIVSWKECRK